MNNVRDEFSSKYGFILAAAGSAVGLGNIWGFPTQVASNGGGAFLLVYLLMTVLLAYPVLMTELLIGRHGKANTITALKAISRGPVTKKLSGVVGTGSILTASLILAFYVIVAGWMIAYVLSPVFLVLELQSLSSWSTSFSVSRNITFSCIVMFLTVAIVCGGVKNGIEKWSSRLMPALMIIILALIVFVMTLDGASNGLAVYLLPDFDQVLNIDLILSALGQAFFSMSLGVGTMLIYGSYLGKNENLPKLAGWVTALDVCVAFLAGLLIIPTIYVAQNTGVEIYDKAGELISEDGLIFAVLPALFENMGGIGQLVSFVFFALLSIAAVTSSISMLEVPVAYAIENSNMKRRFAAILIGIMILISSILISCYFELLFGLVISIATKYSQPIIGFMLSIFVGWIWWRQKILEELKSGSPDIENSLFWKIWPNHIKYVCPVIIFVIIFQAIL